MHEHVFGLPTAGYVVRGDQLPGGDKLLPDGRELFEVDEPDPSVRSWKTRDHMSVRASIVDDRTRALRVEAWYESPYSDRPVSSREVDEIAQIFFEGRRATEERNDRDYGAVVSLTETS